jgi:von Willebrand factor type A domain
MTESLVGSVSFLTPLDALFALAAVLPLAALLRSERAAARVRRLLAIPAPRRRHVVPAAAALVLLTGLVAAAAAQPIVVRRQLVSERADAQAYFVFDTSLSMKASTAPGQPTRLARAKRLALRLRARLPDLPVGIASMTDRTVPNLMPTTDPALFARTLSQSVAIDSPPPSQAYHGRATTFAALVPIVVSRFFSQGVARRVLVVFTDGEAQPLSSVLRVTLKQPVTPIFVHVWSPQDLLYDRAHGRKPDRGYVPDPASALALDQLATLTGGSAYSETQLSQIAHATRQAVGYASTQKHVSAYARDALAPWFVLGGILPLGFLLYRRNL